MKQVRISHIISTLLIIPTATVIISILSFFIDRNSLLVFIPFFFFLATPYNAIYLLFTLLSIFWAWKDRSTKTDGLIIQIYFSLFVLLSVFIGYFILSGQTLVDL